MKSIVTLFVSFFVLTGTLAQADFPRPEPKPRNRVYFVGCRPSPGECVHSCPTRKAAWHEDKNLCDPEDYRNRLACYCIVGPGVFDAQDAE